VVVRRGPMLARGSRVGSAPIQKPPSGLTHRAGEYCPQVDVGKTTPDGTARTLMGRFDNGLRRQYA
jgi:hypothetical protein